MSQHQERAEFPFPSAQVPQSLFDAMRGTVNRLRGRHGR